MIAQLAAAATPEQVLSACQQRQDMLNRVQSDHMLTQACRDWALASPTAYPSPWIGAGQVQGLWAKASWLYPGNLHLVVLQRVLRGAAPSHAVTSLTSSLTRATPLRHDSHTMSTPR